MVIWRNAFEEVLRAYPPDGGLAPDAPAEQCLRALIHSNLHRILDAGRLGRAGRILIREMSDPSEAIHQAGSRRFRPILMTTLTTFGGLAPMIFETSRQARFMIPMAISLGFGILFATSITLVIVPCLYLMAEDVRTFFRRLLPQSQDISTMPSPQAG